MVLWRRTDSQFWWQCSLLWSFDDETDVYKSLFDFVDFGTASTIQGQIEIALDNFEPRIENVVVQVDPQPDNNTFNATISYEIIGQEFPVQEYSFLLEATR